MAKTANAVSSRKVKVELVISPAMVTALASLTTAESIDISQIVKAVGGGGIKRPVTKEWVSGDDEPLADYETRIERGDITVSFLYTNGKDQLGTDLLDIPAILREIAEYTASDLSPQIIYSLAGGNVGDEEFTTHATETRLTDLTDPVGGVDTGGKVQQTATFFSPALTPATVV